MITGGVTTLTLQILNIPLPFGLDPNIIGITASALSYFFTYIIRR